MANIVSSWMAPRARLAVDSAMIDSSVNSRTSATEPCAIFQANGMFRLPEFSHLITFARWWVMMPDNLDVAIGDQLTVAGKGVYNVIEIENPTTYDCSTDVICAREKNAAGVSLLPTNTTITLQMKRDRIPTGFVAADYRLTNLPVFVSPLTPQIEEAYGFIGYGYSFVVDPSKVYPHPDNNGETLIRQGDVITWSGLDGNTNTLARVLRTYEPFDRLIMHVSGGSAYGG